MSDDFRCPFCGREFVMPTNAFSVEGAIADVSVLSIECTCGATYALCRGRRACPKDGN